MTLLLTLLITICNVTFTYVVSKIVIREDFIGVIIVSDIPFTSKKFDSCSKYKKYLCSK